VVIHSDDHFAQVGYLRISKHHLEPKASFSAQSNEHQVLCPCQAVAFIFNLQEWALRQWPVYESWKETNEGNQVIASSIQKETIVDPPKTTEIELSQDSHGSPPPAAPVDLLRPLTHPSLLRPPNWAPSFLFIKGHFFACSSVAVPESADEASEQLNCILFTIKREISLLSLHLPRLTDPGDRAFHQVVWKKLHWRWKMCALCTST